MIEFINISRKEPYRIFENFYNKALECNQKTIEAISISSYSKEKNEVESRFVNLKYIINDEWVFFSNYESIKARNFNNHDQISALFYWNSTNVQIRLKAYVKKSDSVLSDKHFKNRSDRKNALAISSNQSKKIASYEDVINNYNKVIDNQKLLNSRPANWGGYSFVPYFFEFWEGDDSRINKRKIYSNVDDIWVKEYLQP